MKKATFACALLALVIRIPLQAQEREDRTLLSQEVMTAIINEVSGERAMQHVMSLVPWQRVRLPSEYGGSPSESQVMMRTVLQLRDFLSGEFTPLPLADVMAVLRAREASGAIALTPVPPASKSSKK